MAQILRHCLCKSHPPLPNLCPSVECFYIPRHSLPDRADPRVVQYASEVERSLYENIASNVSGCCILILKETHVQTFHGLQDEYISMVWEQYTQIGMVMTERRHRGVQGLLQQL